MSDNLTVAIIVIVLVITGLGVAGYFYFTDKQRQERARKNDLSASRSMLDVRDNKARARELMMRGDRLAFGYLVDPQTGAVTDQLVMEDSDSSVDLYGGPGSGKTTGVLIPAVLRHRGPALVSTTKSDLAMQTVEARRHDGTIAIADPAEVATNKRALANDIKIWTPISEGVTWSRARSTARALLAGVEGAEESSGNEFFTDQATNLVAALLVYLRTQEGASLRTLSAKVEELNPPPEDGKETSQGTSKDWMRLVENIDHEINQLKSYAELVNPDALKEPRIPDGLEDLHEKVAENGTLPIPSSQDEAEDIADYKEYLEQRRSYEKQLEARTPEHYQARLDEIKPKTRALIQARDNLTTTVGAASAHDTRAGIIGSVGKLQRSFSESFTTYEQPWDHPESLDLDALVANRHTLYLICPEILQRPLTNALFGSYISALKRKAAQDPENERLEEQHLVVLDELVHCTPHPDIPNWTGNLGRSTGIKFFICTQAFSDLIATYGEHTAISIHNNCSGGHLLLSQSSDPKAAELFSGQAGKRELIQTQSLTETEGNTKNYTSAWNKDIQKGRSSSSKSTSASTTRSVVEKDVATFANISAMRKFYGLGILKGTEEHLGGPVQFRATPYFEDPDMVRASEGDRHALARVRDLPNMTPWSPPSSSSSIEDLAEEAFANVKVSNTEEDDPEPAY